MGILSWIFTSKLCIIKARCCCAYIPAGMTEDKENFSDMMKSEAFVKLADRGILSKKLALRRADKCRNRSFVAGALKWSVLLWL